jgi:hypothetical protein
MKFSLLSWNIEHFKGNGKRTKLVVDYIKNYDPDVFGLFEIEGADILNLMKGNFLDYDFAITDGPQTQEILVGWRRDKFDQAIFTQKREFKVYNPSLRPGALFTSLIRNDYYNILFLHTDSGTEAPDFGNRAEMFEKAWKMKIAIDKLSKSSKGNLIIIGDLNTMGLEYPKRSKKHQKVSEEEEIFSLKTFAEEVDMQLLEKEYDKTFNNGKIKSNLDHVIVSKNIKIKEQGKSQDNKVYYVKVAGWQQLSGSQRDNFIKNISDHCLLYLEIL